MSTECLATPQLTYSTLLNTGSFHFSNKQDSAPREAEGGSGTSPTGRATRGERRYGVVSHKVVNQTGFQFTLWG